MQGLLSPAPDLTLTLDRTDLEKAMIGTVSPQQVAEGTAPFAAFDDLTKRPGGTLQRTNRL